MSSESAAEAMILAFRPWHSPVDESHAPSEFVSPMLPSSAGADPE